MRDLDEVIFGILSEKDIRDMAVCQIDNPKLCNSDKNGGYGTVYDPRLGPIENNKPCETCGMDIWKCCGHFAFIELNEPIIHPLFYKRVVDFLKCICIKCNKLLITEDQINLNNFTKLRSTKRFDKILEKVEKIDICPSCSQPQPDIKYSSTDNNISMVYKQKDKGKISIVIPVDDIKRTFENLTDEDVKLLGFDYKLVHPKSLIMTVFPVIPYCFLKDTIVLTNNGYKNIQDIDLKDKLYSHTGKFQKINEIFIREYTGDKIINIKVIYHPNIIKCTPEHPFYIKEPLSKVPSWIEAGDLKENQYVGMKRNMNNIIPDFLTNDIACEEIWYFFGIFLSKGYLIRNKFCIIVNNENVKKISELLTLLDVNHNIIKTNYIECNNSVMYSILNDFGNIGNKKIPNWIQDAPIKYIKKFLEGFDYKRNIAMRKNVAFSLQLLFMKLGKILEIKKSGKKDNYILDILEDSDDILIEEDYIWYKICKIEKEVNYCSTVYNFEVNEDNSYCVENIMSHNCARPFVLADGQTCDDDLTIQIVEIIKANNHLKIEDETQSNETKRQKFIQTLKFRISTFYNNSQGRAKHTTNGRPIKGLKERITGKDGLIRSNIMGKRGEFTARTVIGPDPTLKMGQLGVPADIAKVLTVPVQVTNYNYDYLNKLVNEGKVNIVKTKDGEKINIPHHIFNRGTRLNHGDVIVRKDQITGKEIEIVINNGKDMVKLGDKLKRNGEFIKGISYPEKRLYHLNIGDICDRQLQNGDIVLLNRQPTKLLY